MSLTVIPVLAVVLVSLTVPGIYAQTRRVPVRKPDVVRLPKDILLDTSPTITEPKTEKAKKAGAQTATADYCSDLPFCPDIYDVDLAVRDNIDLFSKGKFEKTADFEKRLPTTLTQIRFGNGHHAGDPMTFFYEAHTEPSYDADEESWTFEFRPETNRDLTCVTVFSEKTGNILCVMALTEKLPIGTLTVRMPPPMAAANDGKLTLAVTGRLTPPYVSDPNTGKWNANGGIYLSVTDFFCLNRQTGQRWKVEPERPMGTGPLSTPPTPPPVPTTTISSTLVGRSAAAL